MSSEAGNTTKLSLTSEEYSRRKNFLSSWMSSLIPTHRIICQGEWRSPDIDLPAVLLYHLDDNQFRVWTPMVAGHGDIVMSDVSSNHFHSLEHQPISTVIDDKSELSSTVDKPALPTVDDFIGIFRALDQFDNSRKYTIVITGPKQFTSHQPEINREEPLHHHTELEGLRKSYPDVQQLFETLFKQGFRFKSLTFARMDTNVGVKFEYYDPSNKHMTLQYGPESLLHGELKDCLFPRAFLNDLEKLPARFHRGT